MVAEGAPGLPIHPGPSAEPLNYIDNGLLAVDVQQVAQGVLVIHIAGELDMLTGPPLQDRLEELLATRPDRVIIDLGGVSFMGSTGLSVLIWARGNAIATGTTLQLSGTSGRAVAVPLEVTGLNQLFEILPTQPTTGCEQR
ncbi:MAG: STAS domain-containing protein [Actinomycetota bacterium]|nr:STAS domain-containing protein [Actinomycetota bacterium]